MTDIAKTIGPDRVKAARYVLAWWEQHPGEDDVFNDMEYPQSQAYRDQLYDKINEATEGDLARCVDRRRDWDIAFGLACSGILK